MKHMNAGENCNMNQRNDKPPQFLYKYFSMKRCQIDMFRNNELYFSNPNTFNDPFDCRALLTSKRHLNEDEYARFLMTCERDDSKHKGKELTRDEKEACKKDAIRQFRNTDKKELMRNINRIIEEGLRTSINQFRVLCLSEKYNDILMWSHYADKHQGFVLEFDTEALQQNFTSPQGGKILYKVFYPPTYSFPSIKDFNERHGTHMFLITKSSQWKYEAEWRILMLLKKKDEFEEKGKCYNFEKGLITRIILGCEMKPSEEEKIKEWIHEYQPELMTSIHKAIKDDNRYNIKTDPDF